MHAITNCKIVIACFEDPCADCAVRLGNCLVITCKERGIDLDSDCLARAGRQLRGLCKAHQLHCGLLQTAVCVRCLHIELYNRLACDTAGVGNCDFSAADLADCDVYRIEFLLKCRVGSAVSERIGDFIRIGPCAAV